jgi:hypothetical protein
MENQNQFVAPQNIVPPPPPSPDPVMLEQKPKMKLWKKILLFLIVVIVLGITTLYNMPRILTKLYPGDAILTDNSSLVLQKVSVPDSDNGFFDLNKITDDMLKIPKNSQGVSFIFEYTDFTKPIQWDQKLVDQVLKDNEQALILLDQAS